jgi:8-amino-7-oxononanoate synthase
MIVPRIATATSGPFVPPSIMNADDWMTAGLADLDAMHLRRRLAVRSGAGGFIEAGGRRLMNLASNDYLALASHPHIVAEARRALEAYGAGATASQLVCGRLPCHEELDRRLAALKRCPAALTFASGYAANAGIVPALCGRGDHVFADRLAHASLLDGIRLSGARLHRFRHNDAGHLDSLLRGAPAKGRRLIVTESVFSMDGDLAPLAELAEVAGRHGAMLLADEAHATGVFGPGGAGRVVELGLETRVTVSMGTLSKALGSAGGFAAGSESLRDWLVNRARSFVYSTGLPPAAAGAALGALDVLHREPGLGAGLRARAAAFRARLRAAGLEVGGGESPIVPIHAGTPERALDLAARLEAAGILAIAIRPPTVPAGTARLRLSVTLAHSPEDLASAVEAIVAAAGAPM